MNISFTFERFRFNSKKVVDCEEKTIEIKDSGDGIKNVDKAYRQLFKKFPEWSTGEPVKDGIGFSSTLMKYD